MGLYGNLPEAKHAETGPEPNPWLAAGKLHPAFRPKVAPPPSVLRKQRAAPAGSQPARQGPVSTGTGPGEEDTGVGVGFSLFGDVMEEYDPARPNDYEEVINERERKKREAQLEAEKQEALRREQERKEREERRASDRRRDREKLWDREREHSKDQERERDRDRDREREREREEFREKEREDDRHVVREGTPSPSSSENRNSGQSPEDSPESPGKGGGTVGAGKDKGMSLAQRMLERFGWREGEGLGKARQGMATPLIAQKTDKRSAVIVNAEKRKVPDVLPMMPPEKKPRVGATLEGKPTKVVLLRNMVPPGEVDDELEEEVARELQKFGNVQRVLIFEVTEPGFPETESVRIFVKFLRMEEATKGVTGLYAQAAIALQGRFFAGRTVKAGFYDEAKFDACDLAPVPGEFTTEND